MLWSSLGIIQGRLTRFEVTTAPFNSFGQTLRADFDSPAESKGRDAFQTCVKTKANKRMRTFDYGTFGQKVRTDLMRRVSRRTHSEDEKLFTGIEHVLRFVTVSRAGPIRPRFRPISRWQERRRCQASRRVRFRLAIVVHVADFVFIRLFRRHVLLRAVVGRSASIKLVSYIKNLWNKSC